MSEPYIGEVRIFGGSFAPLGWAVCNGQVLQIGGNEALFTLLGTTYGGDGLTTFGLPNLAGRMPIGQSASHAIGESAGQESVALTLSQLPTHTHEVRAVDAPASSTTPAGNLWATWADTPYSTDAPLVSMDPAGVSVAGIGLPHDNRAPYLGMSFIIALEGIFPSQA
ncbi:tail fiber protein [Nocardioides sp.]|uniref:phage tail protein n=1 Tax=Nocardioides sp. TaxID=35761 RepID=UPI0031FEAB39|nr:hypothetical protein [Nocardioides sp.]